MVSYMKKDIEVNYKNKKKYKINKYPIRQPIYLTALIWILSKFTLIGKKYKIEKINFDKINGPAMILSNHMSFLDFELLAMGTGLKRINNVVNLDGFYHRAWLLEWIGAIPTRKFAADLFLIKSIKKVLSRNDILCMYPEARYSPCGVLSFIPDSVAQLIKKMNVDIYVVIHRGNHLNSPFWNFRKKRKVPFHTTIKKILTAEDIKNLTKEEIYNRLINEFQYDEYKYQLDNNILIKEKYRAENLNRILYKCPHCKSEHMASKDDLIWCEECNKKWRLNENGTLSSLDGNDIFTHIPDWFNWERIMVEEEINNNEYNYIDDCDVFSLPRANKFIKLGKARITHDPINGFIINGNYRNADYYINRSPLQINSLHVEYEYFRIRRADCFVINTENDSFFCYPSKENIITKLAFATEIIYQNKLKSIKQ